MEGRTGLLNSEENTYKIVRTATFYMFCVCAYLFVFVWFLSVCLMSVCLMSVFLFLLVLFLLFAIISFIL